ncbi:DNA repair endonuclease XPF [Cichlidogyrus casuarinus]|uniref:DNA repair endonuclease XPF n=1 Tax=Cichlidogyrus casuarinus TaxID=1844966 RepID=A0ABD2PTW0_9PLAT
MTALLEYEKAILLDIHDKTSMLITSDGLSLDMITYCTIKVHCDPHNLVLICNHSVNEAKHIIEKLKSEGECYPPQLITAEVTQRNRESIYKSGSVVFVSSRILVVDLLLNRVPVDLVSGVIIFRCNQLQSSCQDSFVIRLLRERNTDIFVKSFSDAPIALTSGSVNAESIMKELAIPNLILWPRFRLEVIDCLKENAPSVDEIKVSMSEDMANCQASLLELIQGTLRELIHANAIFKNEEFTLESALSASFDRLVACYLDPIWHELNNNVKQLLNDLSNLRRLLYRLIENDPYTFYKHLETLRQSEVNSLKAIGEGAKITGCSAWMLMDQTGKLMQSAKNRVFKNGDKKENFHFEKNAKLSMIVQLICELVVEMNGDAEQQHMRPPMLLILVNRMHSVNMILRFLKGGEREVESWLSQTDPVSEEENLLLFQSEDLPPGCFSKPLTSDWFKNQGKCVERGINVVIRCPMPGCGEEGIRNSLDAGGLDPRSRLSHTLETLRPTHLITFEPKLSWIREIETYIARLPMLLTSDRTTDEEIATVRLHRVQVYFMIYADSIEEQRYLTSIRREKEAFEKLIQLSASIVIPKDVFQAPSKMQDANASSSMVVTETPTVFVDIREFRSELPAMLYRNGLKVEPMTLTTADYILSPHLAVERKSVADLIGSLNNGHLYQQCTVLARNYASPILLIEFTLPTSHKGSFYSPVIV